VIVILPDSKPLREVSYGVFVSTGGWYSVPPAQKWTELFSPEIMNIRGDSFSFLTLLAWSGRCQQATQDGRGSSGSVSRFLLPSEGTVFCSMPLDAG
jgi:hypothetical protein